MPPYRNLDVLDAAQLAEDEIQELIANASRLIHRDQLRRSAESMRSNIREGMGRGPGRDRAQFLRSSRASAEEAIGQLQSNMTAGLITAKVHWRHHNRLVVIVRMLNSLLQHPSSGPGNAFDEQPPRAPRRRRKRKPKR